MDCEKAVRYETTRKLSVAKPDTPNFKKARLRKHHHWLVTVTYSDNGLFGRLTSIAKRRRSLQHGRRNRLW